MALTLGTTARNAACDAVVDLLDAGAAAAKIRIKSAGAVILVEITLADPAFGAAAAGVATAAGLPKSGTGLAAAGSGTDATQFDAVDSNDVAYWSGTVTVTGGGGDLTLDNTSIAQNQTVTITSLTHTQPA